MVYSVVCVSVCMKHIKGKVKKWKSGVYCNCSVLYMFSLIDHILMVMHEMIYSTPPCRCGGASSVSFRAN